MAGGGAGGMTHVASPCGHVACRDRTDSGYNRYTKALETESNNDCDSDPMHAPTGKSKCAPASSRLRSGSGASVNVDYDWRENLYV